MKEITYYTDKKSKNSILNKSCTYHYAKNQMKLDLGKLWRIPTKEELIYLNTKNQITPLRVYWTNKQLRVMFTANGICSYVNQHDVEFKKLLGWVIPVKCVVDKRKIKKTTNKKLKPKKMTEAKVYDISDDELLSNPNIKFTAYIRS